MTLPVALLIASHNHESISHEIREIVGEKLSILESLSCKCKGHLSRLRLVPPSPCCSPISELGSTSSEASSSSYCTAKTYSYFSDTASDSDDGSDCQDLIENEAVRCLNILVDLVENVTIRFKESYIFKQDEVTINYQKRDILDLGKNIQQQFPIKHPGKSQKLVLNNPEVESKFRCQASNSFEGVDNENLSVFLVFAQTLAKFNRNIKYILAT